jgi:molecular chaperone GrpE
MSEPNSDVLDEQAVPPEAEAAAQSSPDVTLESLSAELEASRQRAADLQDQALRMAAEMQNLRRRTERDVENAHKYALEKFASDMLPVVDSLERGLQAAGTDESTQSVREGVELTLRMLVDVLRKHGLEAVEQTGVPFDPSRHEAMSMQPSTEHAPNTVMLVLQKGWMLNGRLVRPAMVIVSRAGA